MLFRSLILISSYKFIHIYSRDYLRSLPRTKPLQIVPPSCVKNPNTSRPDIVNVGAVPDAHLTPVHQVIVAEPPLVKSRINEIAVPLVGTFDIVKVVVADIVLKK